MGKTALHLSLLVFKELSDKTKKEHELRMEPTNKIISSECSKVASFLNYYYIPWQSVVDDADKEPGWYDDNNNWVGRSKNELVFLFRNIKCVKKLEIKIKEINSDFELKVTDSLEEMFRSKDPEDVYLARAIKIEIWKKCIEFIKRKK